MIYRLLYKLLHDAEEVRNIVGTRIYPEHAPEKSQAACIILRHMSGEAEYHLAGESDCAHGIIQVDCYDASTTKAHRLYQWVRNAISGYRGVAAVLGDGGTEEDVMVSEITILRPGALVDEPRDASDKWSYRWSADFNVFYSQSVPTLT
jgi:hypothetical protein